MRRGAEEAGATGSLDLTVNTWMGARFAGGKVAIKASDAYVCSTPPGPCGQGSAVCPQRPCPRPDHDRDPYSESEPCHQKLT
jgi:hypothetical protein